MTIPGNADPIDPKWEQKAKELQFTALENIKSAAEKWATTISSLTGLLGIITLIKGPEDINGLTPDYQAYVGIALATTLLCAFLSIYYAAIAAQGIPSEIWANGRSLRDASQLAAKEAARRLSISRKLVIPAVLALAVAVGLTWFGERTSKADSTAAIVVQNSGAVMCGELTVGEQGNLQLKPTDKTITELNDVATLSIVDRCP
jgi:hypothetical protein